mgnify:CR=1 FL=1
MIGNNSLEVIIFAEIGKTNFSSIASEELLTNLLNSLNLNKKRNIAQIFFYPIYGPKNIFKWLFFVPKKTNNTIQYFFSTSIKLLRDLIYIISAVVKIFLLNPRFSFFYNLNKFQIKILSIIKKLFKIKFNLIQADGYLLDHLSLNMFDNVIVFSNFAYQKYKNYSLNTKLFFSYASISDSKKSKFISKLSKNKFVILHAGSISPYNTSEESIKKIFEFCEYNKNCKVYFTNNQKLAPKYFLKLLKIAPPNFVFKGFISKNKLKNLLKEINIGLDLRNYLDKNSGDNNCDFPSKIIFYLKNNLYVISTKSESIPYYLRDCLIPINEIFNLDNVDFKKKEIQINKFLEKINSQGLDQIFIKNFIEV